MKWIRRELVKQIKLNTLNYNHDETGAFTDARVQFTHK